MRALVFAILVAGCGGSQSTTPATPAAPPPAESAAPASAAGSAAPAAAGPDAEGLLAKMGEFKDRLCACPDQQCAEGVGDDMRKWTEDLKRQGVKDPHLTDDQTKRAAAIGEALGTCMKRINNMGG